MRPELHEVLDELSHSLPQAMEAAVFNRSGRCLGHPPHFPQHPLLAGLLQMALGSMRLAPGLGKVWDLEFTAAGGTVLLAPIKRDSSLVLVIPRGADTKRARIEFYGALNALRRLV